MSTILTVFFGILATVLFLFFYWRHLHEDYTVQKIFQSGFYQIFTGFSGIIIFYFLSKTTSQTAIYKPDQLWFWGLILGIIIGFLVVKWKFKFRMNEVLEASTAGFLYATICVVVLEIFRNFDLSLVIAGGFIIFLIMLFYYLKNNYKKFGWYHSGKIGFASLVTLTVFFIVRGVVAIFLRPNMISFIGRIDGLISVAIAFVVFLQLYNLSQRK